MIGLSKENGKSVQVTFNDATFAVTADTNPDWARLKVLGLRRLEKSDAKPRLKPLQCRKHKKL